ncbi:MAG: hypothetical protein IKO85_05025 [Bacteroidaceae bacterium]|nr:hypothetical protein [Bacteroidaceae bacterium]
MDIQQIFNALKTKYPQSGLSDNEIQGLAKSLFATGLVTDENLATIVDGQADAMKGFQSLFDSRFTAQKNNLTSQLTASLEKSFMEKYHIDKDGKQVVETQDPPKDATMEAIAKLMDEKLKPLSDKITAEETRRSQEQRTAEIVEKAKAHGISEALAKMLNVPSDVTDLDSFMKDKSQELANLGFHPSVPPSEAGGGKTDGEAFAEQIRQGAPKTE